MNYWLVKSEPDVYSWSTLQKEGRTFWSGVRNYQARNNLAAMKSGDKVLFYHSQSTKDVVGVAEVVGESYPDPTSPDDPRWLVVDLSPSFSLLSPVTLSQFKADDLLKESALVKQSRLSVMPLTEAQYLRVLELGKG
jgi:predicted RNA-binding protein with PUA-like domain